MNRDSDTHPEGGNSVQHEVPFMGSAGPQGHRPDYISALTTTLLLRQHKRTIDILSGDIR